MDQHAAEERHDSERGCDPHPALLRCLLAWCAGLGGAQALRSRTSSSVPVPGSKFEVRLDFDDAPPAELQSYTIEKPARIAIDFPAPQSRPGAQALQPALRQRHRCAGARVRRSHAPDHEPRQAGALRDARRRQQPVPHRGQDADAEYYKQESDPNTLATRSSRSMTCASEISDLQFQRAGDGRGPPDPELTDPSVDVNVFSEAGDVKVEFLDTTCPSGSCAATTSRTSPRR
jgi:type IV pilus assembly protein PilQ